MTENAELRAWFKATYPELKGCVFIVTYGRSGSTLLQNMLMTIPGCVVRGENFNAIQPLFETAQRARRSRTQWKKGGPDPSHPWYGAHQIAPAAYRNAMVKAFVRHVISPPQDVRWLGFKEIRYHTMGERFPAVLDFLRDSFFNTHIVMSTRDREQVLKSGWWPKHDPDKVRGMVERMDERFAAYHAENPGTTSLVDYKDFSRDPKVLEPTFKALDEPFDEAALSGVMSRRLKH